MRAVFVADDDTLAAKLRDELQTLTIDLIQYRNPLKALDNIEELIPEFVIISAKDFPRHWKPLAVDIRAYPLAAASVIILLKGKFFDEEEARKAEFLGIDAIVDENEACIHSIKQFVQEKALSTADAFVFSHPHKLTPIVGTVRARRRTALTFEPESPALASDIPEGTEVPYASLRTGQHIRHLCCTLVKQNGSCLEFSMR